MTPKERRPGSGNSQDRQSSPPITTYGNQSATPTSVHVNRRNVNASATGLTRVRSESVRSRRSPSERLAGLLGVGIVIAGGAYISVHLIAAVFGWRAAAMLATAALVLVAVASLADAAAPARRS